MSAGTIVRGIDRGVRVLEHAAVSLLLAEICVIMATQVVFRFVLRSPLAWSDELATYSFVWVALLGSAVGVRERAHIGVDVVVRLFAPAWRRLVALAALLVVAAFLVSLVKLGVDLLSRVEDQRSAALAIRLAWVYLAVPVSAALMLVHVGQELAAVIGGRETVATTGMSL